MGLAPSLGHGSHLKLVLEVAYHQEHLIEMDDLDPELVESPSLSQDPDLLLPLPSSLITHTLTTLPHRTVLRQLGEPLHANDQASLALQAHPVRPHPADMA